MNSFKSTEFSVVSGGRTHDELVKALEAKRVAIGGCAKAVVSKPSAMPLQNRRYDLVFMGGPSIGEVQARAESKGLLLCSREVPLLVREQLVRHSLLEVGFEMLVATHLPVTHEGKAKRLYLNMSSEHGDCFIGAWDHHPLDEPLPEGRGLIYVKRSSAI